MGRTKGDVDELIRLRINELVGYKTCHIPTETLFEGLGLDYNNRREYNQIMTVIHKDRQDFCNGAWEPLREMLVEPTYDDYKRAFRKCLEHWYLKHRTLVYPYPDGWGTPLKLEDFEKFEVEIAQHLAKSIVNKEERLRRVAISLPYGKTIKQLGNELKWLPFLDGLTRIFKKIRKIIRRNN